MKTITISADLGDILREAIDNVARFKRDVALPEETLRAWKEGKSLSNDQDTTIVNGLCGALLRIFLESKEGLVIPNDAVHRLAEEIHTDLDNYLGGIGIEFAYQDFYGYQLVDKLEGIVRRALKVRDVFAKNHPPLSVKRLCQEAYQSYLYGYHTASMALIRCMVEATLKDRLNIDVGELQELNDMALYGDFYKKKTWDKIDQIRRKVNSFVHEANRGKTPSEYENLKLLGLAQEVLQALME